MYSAYLFDYFDFSVSRLPVCGAVFGDEVVGEDCGVVVIVKGCEVGEKCGGV